MASTGPGNMLGKLTVIALVGLTLAIGGCLFDVDADHDGIGDHGMGHGVCAAFLVVPAVVLLGDLMAIGLLIERAAVLPVLRPFIPDLPPRLSLLH